MSEVLQRFQSTVSSAVDSSLRKGLPSSVHSLLLWDAMKIAIQNSCADLNFQGRVNNGIRETYRLQDDLKQKNEKDIKNIITKVLWQLPFLSSSVCSCYNQLSLIQVLLTYLDLSLHWVWSLTSELIINIMSPSRYVVTISKSKFYNITEYNK